MTQAEENKMREAWKLWRQEDLSAANRASEKSNFPNEVRSTIIQNNSNVECRVFISPSQSFASGRVLPGTGRAVGCERCPDIHDKKDTIKNPDKTRYAEEKEKYCAMGEKGDWYVIPPHKMSEFSILKSAYTGNLDIKLGVQVAAADGPAMVEFSFKSEKGIKHYQVDAGRTHD